VLNVQLTVCVDMPKDDREEHNMGLNISLSIYR